MTVRQLLAAICAEVNMLDDDVCIADLKGLSDTVYAIGAVENDDVTGQLRILIDMPIENDDDETMEDEESDSTVDMFD